MKNKKGQAMLAILFAVMFYIFGMLVFNLLGDEVAAARVSLSCATPSIISDGTKLTCLIIDGVIPYFIIGILSLAGGIITSKLAV